jgi:hypothetical protein
VEAFLIHDLAHLGRGDYLVNLSQSLVEGLLFFQPGVWRISTVVRAERENWCDDTVVALTEDPGGWRSLSRCSRSIAGSIPGVAGGDRRESVRAGPASIGSEPAQRCLRARSRGVVSRGWYGT